MTIGSNAQSGFYGPSTASLIMTFVALQIFGGVLVAITREGAPSNVVVVNQREVDSSRASSRRSRTSPKAAALKLRAEALLESVPPIPGLTPQSMPAMAPDDLLTADFTLSEEKADKLYDALVDAHVKPIVARVGRQQLRIKATPREIDVIRHVVDVLSRTDSLSRRERKELMAEVKQGKAPHISADLPDNAGEFFELLAFDDVPVLVSRSGARVTVQADDPDDRRALLEFAELLNGARLE